MSQTWRLKDGDFELTKTGNPIEIESTEKLKQDIVCLILTPASPNRGYDLYHPEAGCDLNISVGSPLIKTKMDVRSTVMKVLQYYQLLQKEQFANQEISSSEVLVIDKSTMGSGGVETFLDDVENVSIIDDKDSLIIKLKLKAKNMQEFVIEKRLHFSVNQ